MPPNKGFASIAVAAEDRSSAAGVTQTLGTVFALTLVVCGAVYVAGLRDLFGSDRFAIPVLAYSRSILVAFAFVLCGFAFGGRHTAASVAAILLMVLGLAYTPASFRFLFDIFAVSISLLGLVRLVGAATMVPKIHILGVVASAVFISLALALINLHHNYSVPVGLEASLVGLSHHDTLFHAAIAQNLLHANVASIGADGLVPITYHVFSHRVIGGFTAWLGTEMLHGYAMFMSIVAIPVLLGLLLQTAAQLHRPASIHLSETTAMFSVLGWLAFGGALMWHSYYSSESYTLSLWMVMLAVLLLHQLVDPANKALPQQIILIVLLGASVALATLSKVSVGAVLACAAAMGLFVAGRMRPWALAVSILAGLLPAVAIYLANPIAGAGDAALIKPFAFFRYAEPAIYALLFALVMTNLARRHFPQDHGTRALTIALGTGMWAGLVASYLLNTPAGAQYYFSDPGSWLGLMLVPVLGLTPKWLTRRAAWGQLSIVLLFIAAMMFLHDRKLRGLDRLEGFQTAFESLPTATSLGERTVQNTAVGQAFLASRNNAGKFDAIVLDGTYEAFWNSQRVCWATSFILPALVGKPMMQGIVPASQECEVTPYYGLADYNLDEGRAPTDLAHDALCATAQARGLTRLLVISIEGHWIETCSD
jgi:hypothetical protein